MCFSPNFDINVLGHLLTKLSFCFVYRLRFSLCLGLDVCQSKNIFFVSTLAIMIDRFIREMIAVYLEVKVST